MEIALVQLSINDGIDVYNMLQRISPFENAFNNDANGLSFEEFKEWLQIHDAWSRGELLPEGYVKQWIYWLIIDGRPVGFGKLRDHATASARKKGGNIGFAIDTIERGKGYGNILFAMLLQKAKEKNIREVFSTVEKNNYASKSVHEKCGGILINEDDARWYFVFDL